MKVEALDPLAARLQVASEALPGLDEVRRIVGLPVERSLSPEEVEAVTLLEVTPTALASGFRLWRQQAEVATAFDANGGVFAPLRVGAGKSLCSYLVIKRAWERGAEKIMLLVPPRLFVKAITRDVPLARKVIGLQAPVHGMGGLTPSRRRALARSGWRGVYVYPYSLLHVETTDEELEAIDPDVVVADEVHALANPRSAQTRRFLAMMRKRLRQFAGFSGTMAKKTLRNYWHLIMLALRERCPLPRESGVVELWASALDTVGRVWEDDEARRNQKGLEPLREWAIDLVRSGRFLPEEVGGPLLPDSAGYRRAFRLRRDTAPGVVASAEMELGASLVIENVPAPSPIPESRVQALHADLARRFPGDEFFVPREAFADLPPFEKLLALAWAVDRRSTTPNGDQIEYGIHIHKWAYELSAGFYNALVWPTTEALARERGISHEKAGDLLSRSKIHHEAKRRHDRELRYFLSEDHVPGLDTPMFVGAACARGGKGVPHDLYDMWFAMKKLDFKERPERVGHVERVCDWKIQEVLRWCRELKKGCLVWVYNVEMGVWASQVLASGLGLDRVLHCPAGDRADRLIQDSANGEKVVVASLTAHSEGKDLFHFAHNYFLQWPRSAHMAEQALGRTHRPGQEADEVSAITNHSLSFDHENMNACLLDAMWLHSTEGRQKLLYADYPELPKRHPPDFLAQRGFDLIAKDQDAALWAVLGEEKKIPCLSGSNPTQEIGSG